jgi:hypothetical protein
MHSNELSFANNRINNSAQLSWPQSSRSPEGPAKISLKFQAKQWLSLLFRQGVPRKINPVSRAAVRLCRLHTVWPNPSLKWSANGSQAGPRHSAGVHFL